MELNVFFSEIFRKLHVSKRHTFCSTPFLLPLNARSFRKLYFCASHLLSSRSSNDGLNYRDLRLIRREQKKKNILFVAFRRNLIVMQFPFPFLIYLLFRFQNENCACTKIHIVEKFDIASNIHGILVKDTSN